MSNLFMILDTLEIGGDNGFCAATAELWQFVGGGVNLLKVILPAILIVLGLVGFGKTIISGKDEDMKKEIYSLIKKLILAIVIAFIPQIVSGLFSTINKFNTLEADYNTCIQCITNPNGDTCKNKVDANK